jgi:hypothetical protein
MMIGIIGEIIAMITTIVDHHGLNTVAIRMDVVRDGMAILKDILKQPVEMVVQTTVDARCVITTMIIVAPSTLAVAQAVRMSTVPTVVVQMVVRVKDGTAIPKDIPKLPAVDGVRIAMDGRRVIPTMIIAVLILATVQTVRMMIVQIVVVQTVVVRGKDGSVIPKDILKLHEVAGVRMAMDGRPVVRTMIIAALIPAAVQVVRMMIVQIMVARAKGGTAIPKDIPKRPVVVGVQAMARIMAAEELATKTMIVVLRAAAREDRKVTVVVRADGLVILRDTRKQLAKAGRTAINCSNTRDIIVYFRDRVSIHFNNKNNNGHKR